MGNKNKQQTKERGDEMSEEEMKWVSAFIHQQFAGIGTWVLPQINSRKRSMPFIIPNNERCLNGCVVEMDYRVRPKNGCYTNGAIVTKRMESFEVGGVTNDEIELAVSTTLERQPAALKQIQEDITLGNFADYGQGWLGSSSGWTGWTLTMRPVEVTQLTELTFTFNFEDEDVEWMRNYAREFKLFDFDWDKHDWSKKAMELVRKSLGC